MNKTTIITNSAQDTQEFAKNLGKKLQGGDVITLAGNLGTGKTTFVQGLAKGIGINRQINSPTFILLRQYEIPEKNMYFYHIDLYRLESEQEILMTGIGEILKQKNSIIVIEWPEKIMNHIPTHKTAISFSYISDTQRRLDITQHKEYGK